MKKTADFADTSAPLAGAAEGAGWRAAWCRFWFAPRDVFGLHLLRVLAGVLFLAWLLPFAGQVDAFFGLNGWYDTQAYQDASKIMLDARKRQSDAQKQMIENARNRRESSLPPTVEEQFLSEELTPFGAPSWSVLFPVGADPTLVQTVYWGSLGVLLLFTLGVWTRLTAVLTFVIVVSFTANPATSYDADRWLPVLAFYLMLGYLLLGQSWRGLSLGERLLGMRGISFFSRTRREEEAAEGSIGANLALRLFQVHFAFLIVMSGLDKLQTGDWWSGTAFWFWLHPPGTTLEATHAHRADAQSYLTLMSLAVYAVLAWQIGFPLFAWRRGWRLVLLGGVVIGWVGLVAMCGLPLFGPILLIASLSYLTPEEWRRWFGFLGKLRPAPAQSARNAAAARKETKETATVP